ncbi:MAG: hypothetical protein JWO63_177 [Frankiales bacterium]|jgi:hypothetical protein|nr:hypothetical protein [Frankiales bacterium]
MRATINALRNSHIVCDPGFVDKRSAPAPRHPAIAICKKSDRAWKVHFVMEGDGITRCGLDAQEMCVQPTGAPRLLLVRACRLCASRVPAAAVREVREMHAVHEPA